MSKAAIAATLDEDQPILAHPELAPYAEVFKVLPPTPPDWAAFIQLVLTLPGMDERDRETLQGWLTWRTLPRRFWQRALDMAARAPCSFSYDDWNL